MKILFSLKIPKRSILKHIGKYMFDMSPIKDSILLMKTWYWKINNQILGI